MDIRRAKIGQGERKVATDPTPQRRYGARPAHVEVPGKSNAEALMAKRDNNGISDEARKSVSDERYNDILVRGTQQQKSTSSPAPLLVYSNSFKKNQELRQQYGMEKTATTVGMGAGTGSNSFNVAGGQDTIRQAPEVYSPLFQIANLQLPRDRITMNAWNRNFYDTHPLVHNCINLHATYPLGKINIKCKHKHVEQFFNDMIEEMDLIGILHNIALEFWKMGEVFPYAELDPSRGVWKNIVIQNPDYIHVKTSVLSGDSVISMRPDAALQRLVTSNNPADVKLRQQIDEEILYHVRKGNNIPLDNFHISHLKMLSSPYDIRGTSVIVSVYKDLMLYDKLRECHSQDTEIIGKIGNAKGVFRGLDLIDYDLEDGKPINVKIKPDVEIACYNPETNQMEFHKPTNVHLSHYKGKMHHFNGKKVDIMVTPNHRMWISKKLSDGWSNWEFKKAKDMSNGTVYRFRGTVEWTGGNNYEEHVNINDKNIPIDLYLKIVGYLLSEGCIQKNRSVCLSQYVSSSDYIDMYKSIHKFAEYLGIKCVDSVIKHGSGFSKHINDRHLWNGTLYNAQLSRYFFELLGSHGKCTSHFKRVPRNIMDLPPSKLIILLDALVAGDGKIQNNKNGNSGFKYFSISKELCDDVSEIVLKCGFAPNTYSCTNGDGKLYWVTSWTESSRGSFPRVYGNKKHRNANIDIVDYDDLVWCFEVPTGLFITRRNGLYTVQGNSKFSQADNLVNPITLVSVGGSAEGEYHPTEADLEHWRQTLEAAQYDKDFKIISHAGVKIERVGASGAIIDIGNDMTFIMDNILYGLMTPKAVITQEGASYNSASIGLEVLKQRYESFRNMIAKWLKVKIFSPISEIQEFYEYDDGNKKLIVPEVDWNQMILFDMDNYINVLTQMTQPGPQGEPPKVSNETLFRSLGLDPEEERRKVRYQMIQDTIAMKEKMTAQKLSLSQLRAIKEDEEIVEPTEEPLPGVPGAVEQGPGGPGGAPGMGGGLGGPGGGLGGPPDLGGGLGGGGLGGGGLGGPPPDLGGGLGGGELGGPPGGELGGPPPAGGGGEAPPV